MLEANLLGKRMQSLGEGGNFPSRCPCENPRVWLFLRGSINLGRFGGHGHCHDSRGVGNFFVNLTSLR